MVTNVGAAHKPEMFPAGARILLVEDDAVLRDLIARNLLARYHLVWSAQDAESALFYLRRNTFDLVILDINLPDQTGWEVLRIAQKEGKLALVAHDGHTGQLPVVVLSAVRVSPRRLQEFHPLASLPKPFPMEAVLRLAVEAAQRRSGEPVTEGEEVEQAQPAFPNEEDHSD